MINFTTRPLYPSPRTHRTGSLVSPWANLEAATGKKIPSLPPAGNRTQVILPEEKMVHTESACMFTICRLTRFHVPMRWMEVTASRYGRQLQIYSTSNCGQLTRGGLSSWDWERG